MRIVEWKCHVIETPIGIDLKTRYDGSGTTREHVIVELVADDGRVGRGEATPLPWFTGETAATIKEVLESEWLGLVVGEDPHELASIHAKLDRRLAGNSSARAAIDGALYDLCAQAAGIPLWQYLGGRGERLPRTYALGIGSTEDVVSEAQEWVGKGYRTLKLKVGVDARADIERVRAVRDAVGPNVALRIDGNGGYDLPTAISVARALEPVGLELVEELFDGRDDPRQWRRFRSAVAVPVMADESIHTGKHALSLAAERLVDFFVIKLIKTGGIRGALEIAAIARAAGAECIVSTPFDTEIGAATALHVALSVGSRGHSHDLPPLRIEERHEIGWINPARAAGVGVANIGASEASWSSEEAAGDGRTVSAAH